MYLTQPLHRIIRQSPDAIATIDGDRQRSWREFGERVARFAGLLHELGLQAGERVALLSLNSDYCAEFILGTMWAGGVINPVNTRWAAREIAYSLVDCETRILIVEHNFRPVFDDFKTAVPCLEHVLFIAPPGTVAPEHNLEERLTRASAVPDALRRGDDLAAILYTGGTTGRSKGVMLTHRSMMSSALGFAGSGDAAPGACVLHTAPLFHIGAISGFVAAMLRQSSHVFIAAFEPISVMQTIAANRVTDTFFVPTMLHALLDHPEFPNHDLSCLERISYGASPMPSSLLDEAFLALPRVSFVQAYGMTELSPVATLLMPEDHKPAARVSGHAYSAGRATMTTEVRIVDTDGYEVPRGIAGEIAVRGEGVMGGYWGMPEVTKDAVRNGWMHTGDIGRMDEAGYVYVLDRLKDMIITGGENVYSAEVESALGSHPAVARCAVIGVPDPRWGEAVHAVVVLRPDVTVVEAELIAHCRAQIANYKSPRGFTFVAALPLSGAGKVLKTELRAALRDKRT